MLRSVGRGTGPDTEAPVRVAVSTISRAARSMASWSYALSRILILLVASVATWSFLSRVYLGLGAQKGATPEWGAAPGRIGYLQRRAGVSAPALYEVVATRRPRSPHRSRRCVRPRGSR